ncbi:type I polyketide synthase [Moorena sp. SIO3H5]|uniref:type I polyketide synthase n=1 Tax=Moorena sp. SIO3H5 TaxID=2607834 RepID=UPI0013B75A77|nr:type I polyketide synthase [Moorena sp. SIO3H5]NEO71582.1 SDR family NAD(P)-dependent oxidoreductase [Moorena sp. SIO3H5]
MEPTTNKEQLSLSKQMFLALKQAEAKLEMMELAKSEPIAIIGIGCRFPGNANTPESFWELLANGEDGVREIPPERWNPDYFYHPDPDTPGKMYIRHASLVDQVDQFEPEFFGISPREAHSLDPQQRFLLEVTWEALERAGINPQQLENTHTGVFLGIGQNDYADLGFNQLENISPYDATGNGFCFAAGRLSYFLGLQGPSLAIDTACSASLVAIHEACHSLRRGESNLALAGGVQLMLSPHVTTALSKLKALSPDGRCKTFDAAADGYGRGEGCGMVVLKRLSDALKDGDQIWAVIRGSAVNHDGPSSGLTVPNKLAQEQLIQQALKAAKIEPSQVGYVEAHGTGTSLGDPMEVRALGTVFEEGHNQEHPLRIGSVKTNIGHLEAAAGIAGLIKVVLQLQHQKIAPSLNFNHPNPYIDWGNIPLEVPTQLTPWSSPGGKRVGGVSSFAISGTNAHIVLEEAPSPKSKSECAHKRPLHLLTLSAKTAKALEDLVTLYSNYLETNQGLASADVCYTANTGRAHFKHRLAVIAADRKELVEKLHYQETGEQVVGLFSGHASKNPPKIVFLFTGQGSQYVNMGRQLYETQPTFRKALEECDQILESYLEYRLLEVLYPQNAPSSSSSLLDQTAYTQPALFAIEYALAKLWESWGIKPNAVMGHSVGEYVAATIAGIFSLEDGLKLIAARGRLMQQLPSDGEMVSVIAKESKVRELITPYTDKVAIAAINGPESVVISGETEAIAAIVNQLESEGVKTKRLQVSHAFHSPLMEPVLAEFEAIANQVTYHQPKIPLISNVTGTKVDNSITTANYWVNHIRQPVKFAASMETLHQQGLEIFLEIGAKPILLGMGHQCLPEGVGVWLPSLRPAVDEWQQILSTLGQLYVHGVQVNWSEFDRDYNHQKIVLPTYPFQRKRYWVETANDWDGKAIYATKLHPLINHKFQSPLSKEIFFESHFSTENLPFLADHIVYEQVVVPGAGHISLLLAAASLTFAATECQIEDILFPQALAIPEQGVRTVQVVLTPQNNSFSFQVISFDDSLESQINQVSNNGSHISDWAVHATGKLSVANAEQSLIPLEEIQARCSKKIDSAEIYQHLWDRQIHLGQSFRWIEQVWLGEGEVLCQMKVPKTILNATKYQLHPTLVDSCFQSIIALVLDQSGNKNETFVPFSIDKFTFYNSSDNELLWCYTCGSKDKQSGEKFKADIQLFDQHGQLVAQVIGFEGRKANSDTLLMTLEADLSHWFYKINWQSQPLLLSSQSNEKQTSNWLVFALTNELTELIGEELQQRGHNCIWVSPGSDYQEIDAQHYQINPTVTEQFQQLLQDNADIKGIVHLWGINETSDPVVIKDIETAQELGSGTVLHLVQALIKTGLIHVMPMWLVTQGTQSVLDESEVSQPHHGSLWGLGRVIRLEHPELNCCRVDLDSKSPLAETIPKLVDELLSNNYEDQIAIRQGIRYVARLVRQQQHKLSSQKLSIQSEACYLITGGLGALGLQVAQWLVAQGAQHLVLIGRSAPSETAREIIENLEALDSQVCVWSGDISEQRDAVRIINQIQDSLPPLKGVIHAAGVLDDSLLQNLSWQQFTKVMAPKVAGTWHLHQLTKDLPLDFFVCFSSMASMLGSPGQGNYAAANAFMDAIANYRRGMGLPGLSINWGPWASAGMAAKLGDEHLDRLHNSGLKSISLNEGMQALEKLLQLEVPQVGVMPINWSQWFEVQAGTTMPMLKDLAPSQSKSSQEGWFIKHLEAVSPEQRRQLLTKEVRSQVAQILGIADPEQIDSQVGLFDIGIDSLMLTELRNRLQSSLGCRLSATTLFNYNTIDDLVDYLAQDVLQLDNVGIDIQDNSPVETPIEMRSDLDNMDQDQVETSISQELEELEVLLRKG